MSGITNRTGHVPAPGSPEVPGLAQKAEALPAATLSSNAPPARGLGKIVGAMMGGRRQSNSPSPCHRDPSSLGAHIGLAGSSLKKQLALMLRAFGVAPAGGQLTSAPTEAISGGSRTDRKEALMAHVDAAIAAGEPAFELLATQSLSKTEHMTAVGEVQGRPEVHSALEALGFRVQSNSTHNFRFATNVNYGGRDVSLTLEIPFDEKNVQSTARYEAAETATHTSDGRYLAEEDRGKIFMGSSRSFDLEMGQRFKVQVHAGKGWGFAEYDPGVTEYHKRDLEVPGGVHSFPALNERFTLAKDLYRAKKVVFDDKSIEVGTGTYNASVPDIDQSLSRGTGLQNTDPTTIRMDKGGHWVRYLSNLTDVLSMDEQSFADLRERTPKFARIDNRSIAGATPLAVGQPYVEATSPAQS